MQLTVNHLFNYLYTMLVINRAIVMLIMYGRAGFELNANLLYSVDRPLEALAYKTGLANRLT